MEGGGGTAWQLGSQCRQGRGSKIGKGLTVSRKEFGSTELTRLEDSEQVSEENTKAVAG